MKFNYKIWLCTDNNSQKLFGKGPYQLLSGVIKYGSLRKSATDLGISYSKAFNTIKQIENSIGFTLLDKHVGGVNGGKSEVTPEALLLMDYYEKFTNAVNIQLEKVYDDVFADFEENLTHLKK